MTTKPSEYHKAIAQEYVNNGFNMCGALKKISSKNNTLTKNGLCVKATTTLRNPNIQREIALILNGFTGNRLNNKLQQLLEAKRITEYKGIATQTDLPDTAEQRKTLEMLLKIKGVLPRQEDADNPKIELKLRLKELNTEQLKELLSGKREEE